METQLEINDTIIKIVTRQVTQIKTLTSALIVLNKKVEDLEKQIPKTFT